MNNDDETMKAVLDAFYESTQIAAYGDPSNRDRAYCVVEAIKAGKLPGIVWQKTKPFPILRQSRYAGPAHPTAIPWEVAELAYADYRNKCGNDQTLDDLARRGGFAPSEMDVHLPDWRERCDIIAVLRAKLVSAEAKAGFADAMFAACAYLDRAVPVFGRENPERVRHAADLIVELRAKLGEAEKHLASERNTCMGTLCAMCTKKPADSHDGCRLRAAEALRECLESDARKARCEAEHEKHWRKHAEDEVARLKASNAAMFRDLSYYEGETFRPMGMVRPSEAQKQRDEAVAMLKECRDAFLRAGTCKDDPICDPKERCYQPSLASACAIAHQQIAAIDAFLANHPTPP